MMRTRHSVLRRVSFGVIWSLVIGHWSFSQSPQPSPVEIRDIAPPVDVFPYPAWEVISAAAVLLLILALAVWLVVRWIRSRPAPPPPTPHETAVASLNKARAQIDALDPYAFSILVSDILRAYVAAQFHLHAREQTSPEFLASISGSTGFSDREKTLLAAFLEKCDLIKFARINATRDDSAALVDQAVLFVEGGAA